MNGFDPSDCPSDCSLRFLCRCLRVTREEVVEAVTAPYLRTVKEVRQHTGAGEGCTACHAHLREVVERYAYPSPSDSPICSVR